MTSYNAGLLGDSSDTVDPRESQEGDELALEANYTIPDGAWYGYGTFVNKAISKDTIARIRYE
jgi:hypothetical protein